MEFSPYLLIFAVVFVFLRHSFYRKKWVASTFCFYVHFHQNKITTVWQKGMDAKNLLSVVFPFKLYNLHPCQCYFNITVLARANVTMCTYFFLSFCYKFILDAHTNNIIMKDNFFKNHKIVSKGEMRI